VRALLLAALLAGLAGPVTGEAPDGKPVTAEDKQRAVTELAKLLRNRYAVAGTAEDAAAAIERKLADGGYSGLTDARAFSEAVKADLRAVTKDKHLDFGVPEPAPAAPGKAADPEAERAAWRARARQGNWGLPRAEVLPGNVGLLEVRRFQPPDLSVETITAAIGFLANVDAVIVDVRGCRGGSAHVMPYFAGYFLARPTSLFDMEFRGDHFTERFWTLPWLPGRRLADVPMYILTSAYTFSGAEGFAYRFQVLKRATVVGETTGGGANAGGVLDVPPFFRVYMPMGRPVDQTTRTNWEGTGVVPDVRTTAPEALYVAHVDALKLLRSKAASDAERARLDLALERAEGRHHPPRLAPAELERLAGDYGGVRVRMEGGLLRLEREPGKPYLLQPLTGTVFLAEIENPVRVEFLAGPDGRCAMLVFTDEDGKREEFARRP